MVCKGRKPQAPSGIIIDLEKVNGVWQIKDNDSNGKGYKGRTGGFFTAMPKKGEKSHCRQNIFDFQEVDYLQKSASPISSESARFWWHGLGR